MDSFNCDPEHGFYYNANGAIAATLNCHKELDGRDVARVLDFIYDDLTHRIKKQPLRKHRLGGPLQALFDNIMQVCRWHLGEEECVAGAPRCPSRACLTKTELSRQARSLSKEMLEMEERIRCPCMHENQLVDFSNHNEGVDGISEFGPYPDIRPRLAQLRELHFSKYTFNRQAPMSEESPGRQPVPVTVRECQLSAPSLFAPPKPPRRSKPKLEPFREGFTLYEPPHSLATAFRLEPPTVAANFHVRVGGQMLMLVHGDASRGLSFHSAVWGGSTFHRGLRSAHAKKRPPRRCLVPVNGFYLMQRVPGKLAIPFYVFPTPPDAALAVAGIWSDNERASLRSPSFSILTVSAPPSMRQMKSIIPMLLPSSMWSRWLEPGRLDRSELDELEQSCETAALSLRQVGRYYFNDNGGDIRSMMSTEEMELHGINDPSLRPWPPGCPPPPSWSIQNIPTLPTCPSFVMPSHSRIGLLP